MNFNPEKVSLNGFAVLFKMISAHSVLIFYVTVHLVMYHARMSIFKKGNFSRNVQFKHRDYIVIHCVQSNCSKHGTGEDASSCHRL